MTTEQIFALAKQVENKVGTLATISNLMKCLEECDVVYLTQDEWDELVTYLERYYIISNKQYQFEIVEAYQEDIEN
jgi:IS1 family transposase